MSKSIAESKRPGASKRLGESKRSMQGKNRAQSKNLAELKNIGKTVAARLHDIGVISEADLRELGAAKAYQWLSAQQPGKHLPLCYYLYSLEGALQDRHWDDFSEHEKQALRQAAQVQG